MRDDLLEKTVGYVQFYLFLMYNIPHFYRHSFIERLPTKVGLSHIMSISGDMLIIYILECEKIEIKNKNG